MKHRTGPAIFSLLILSLLLACQGKQGPFDIPPPEDVRPAHGFKGAVKSANSATTNFEDTTVGPQVSKTTWTFTREGQLLHLKTVANDIESERSNVFDSLGRKVEVVRTSPLGQEKELSRYADHGLLSESQTFNEAGELLSKETFKYRDDGKLAFRMQVLYNREEEGGSPTTVIKVSHSYDPAGNKTLIETRKGGKLMGSESFAGGRWVERIQYAMGSEAVSSLTRRHYADTSVTDSSFLPDGKLIFVFHQAKDSAGNAVRVLREYAEPGSLSESRYTYNEQGDLATHREFYRKGRVGSENGSLEFEMKTHAYTYDEKGNWTSQRVFRGGVLVEEIERKIEYW